MNTSSYCMPSPDLFNMGGHSSQGTYQYNVISQNYSHYKLGETTQNESYRGYPPIPEPPRPSFAPVEDMCSTSSQPKYSDRYKSSSYPKDLTNLFEAKECKLCSVELLSPIVAKMHYSGKQHQKKVNKYMLDWSKRTGLPIPENVDKSHSKESASKMSDYCQLCDVKLTSVNDKLLHYSGKQHRKNERDPINPKRKKKAYETYDLSDQRFGIGIDFTSEDQLKAATKSQEYVCELCDVQAVSHEQLQAHLNGKKHKERIVKKEVLPKTVKPTMSILASVVKEQPHDTIDYSAHRTPTGQYYCGVCDLTLNSERQFIEHIENNKHKKKLIARK